MFHFQGHNSHTYCRHKFPFLSGLRRLIQSPTFMYVCMYVCMCVCGWVRACVRACACVCMLGVRYFILCTCNFSKTDQSLRGHEGADGEVRYSSALSLTLALD